jgi:hypothetical protein
MHVLRLKGESIAHTTHTVRQPNTRRLGEMRNLILVAFAAIALVVIIVPVTYAAAYDNMANTPSQTYGLNGGGG